jgi:hypothetical protein
MPKAEGGWVAYEVHRLDVRTRRDRDEVEAFLNGLEHGSDG